MTSEIYFPEQRHMLPLTLIRRERLLPPGVTGELLVRTGSRVSLRDVVARGQEPAPYVLLNAAEFFNLRPNADLNALLQVAIGDLVGQGQVVAQRGRRKLLSPIDGYVRRVEQGRIIMQEEASPIDLEAGLNGTVVDVRRGRGVVIETYGAVLQGVWGNNRRAIGPLRPEPRAGIESFLIDAIDTQYRGAIIFTRRPLSVPILNLVEEQGFSGVIAPSMESGMIEMAMEASTALLLTEGFGSQRMSTANSSFLEGFEGRQATMDALLPAPMEMRRPEVVINVPLADNRPPAPNVNLALQPGMTVRLARGSAPSVTGTVVDLPKIPILLENGLQVFCAQVEVNTGEKLMVPLANLEVTG
jgi:hypothetical protein